MRSVAEIFASHEEVVNGKHVNGTDKNGPNHQYGDAYESLIASTLGRLNVNLMLEVGVADGSSLCAWSEVFPNAKIVGLDIHPIAKTNERIEFHLGDQRSKADCERAAAGRQFDFICEDATHVLENNLLTLFWLWPFVKPDGVYVIEEFANVGEHRERILSLWPQAEIIDTKGPFGGIEPLVVFRKR